MKKITFILALIVSGLLLTGCAFLFNGDSGSFFGTGTDTSTTAYDYLKGTLKASPKGAYTVSTGSASSSSDWQTIRWSVATGSFMSFAVSPNTTYYLSSRDSSRDGYKDARYSIYSGNSRTAVLYSLDTPSGKSFTTGSSDTTYYILVAPYSSSDTSGSAAFRIYRK